MLLQLTQRNKLLKITLQSEGSKRFISKSTSTYIMLIVFFPFHSWAALFTGKLRTASQHVIPCTEGYVIGSAIKHIPIAGRDISQFVLNLMRECSKMAVVPPGDQLRVASRDKENYSYVCQDIVKEFCKYDADPYQCFQRFEGEHSFTGRVSQPSFPWSLRVDFSVRCSPLWC